MGFTIEYTCLCPLLLKAPATKWTVGSGSIVLRALCKGLPDEKTSSHTEPRYYYYLLPFRLGAYYMSLAWEEEISMVHIVF